MSPRLEEPHIRLVDRDGDAWPFPVHELPSAMAAWTAGHAFWSGVDCWGAAVTLRLFNIVAISHWTAESIAAHAEDAEIERQRSITDGL
jgi:hypothetical protein